MLNRSGIFAMSTSVLKALPCKLDIKRHLPSFLYLLVIFRFSFNFDSYFQLPLLQLHAGPSFMADVVHVEVRMILKWFLRHRQVGKFNLY